MARIPVGGPRASACAVRRPLHYSRVASLIFIVTLLVAPREGAAQAAPSFTQQVATRVNVLVNEFRIEHGVQPLKPEDRLSETAAYFATYMADSGNLDHLADGNTPAARVKRRGYAYCVIGENIAFEYSSRGFTPERLARNFVEGWRDSPTHRANMLDAAVTETGIAVAQSGKGEYYAAQLFGRPVLKGARKSAACRR